MKKRVFFVLHIVRRYPFSSICLLLIWVLSLIPFFPETPLDNVQLIDKWVHLAMYGGTCGVMWLEYLHRHRSLDFGKLFLLAFLMPALTGGVLELLQEYCTTTRNGDWLDFAADGLGVVLGNLFGQVCSILRWKF